MIIDILPLVDHSIMPSLSPLVDTSLIGETVYDPLRRLCLLRVLVPRPTSREYSRCQTLEPGTKGDSSRAALNHIIDCQRRHN
jgi:hypothetical protein